MAAQVKVDKLFGVEGLVALVTGGGTGIGLMLARALAHAGASRVYICGRRLDKLQEAATAISSTGPTGSSSAAAGVVVPLVCDVTSVDSLRAAAAAVEKEAGFVNLLVCNSGIGGPQVPAPPQDGSIGAAEWAAAQMAVAPDEFNDTLRVNAGGVWYTTMAFLKLLDLGNKKGNVQQSSQVIVISSIASFNKKAPGGFAYGASKAAATHIGKMLSIVLPTYDIRANILCPGLFPSEMAAPILARVGASGEAGEVIPMPKDQIPVGRCGDEQDMAGQVLYLASRAGAYCNGNTMVVDGGRLGTFPGLY